MPPSTLKRPRYSTTRPSSPPQSDEGDEADNEGQKGVSTNHLQSYKLKKRRAGGRSTSRGVTKSQANTPPSLPDASTFDSSCLDNVRFVFSSNKATELATDYTPLLQAARALSPAAEFFAGLTATALHSDRPLEVPEVHRIVGSHASVLTQCIRDAREVYQNVQGASRLEPEVRYTLQTVMNSTLLHFCLRNGAGHIDPLRQLLHYLGVDLRTPLLAAIAHVEGFYWQICQTPGGRQHSLLNQLPLTLPSLRGGGVLSRVRRLLPHYVDFFEEASLLDADAFNSSRSLLPPTSPARVGGLYDGEAMIVAINLLYLDSKNRVRDLTMSHDIVLHSPVQYGYLPRIQAKSRLVYKSADEQKYISLKFEKYSQDPVTTRNSEVNRYLRPMVRGGYRRSKIPQTALLVLRPAPGDMSVIRDFFQNHRFPKDAVRAVLDWGPPNWKIDLQPFFEMPNLSHVVSFNPLDPKFEGQNLHHSFLYSQGLSRLKSKMF